MKGAFFWFTSKIIEFVGVGFHVQKFPWKTET